MRKQVIVTSSISPRRGSFTYSHTRSFFGPEERLRQTIFTVNSLSNSLPGCKIVVVDISDDYKEYQSIFRTFERVEFIPIKELSWSVFEAANTHKNKSYCESLILNTYYNQYKDQLKQVDFIGKTSGRYFHFNFNDSLLTENNKDKIFFKKRLGFEWSDSWNYQMVDHRKEQGNNLLHQYSSVLYMFGSSHLDNMININEEIIQYTGNPDYYHYDVETLMFHLTRKYQDQIIETNWVVSGWDGVSGRLVYY